MTSTTDLITPTTLDAQRRRVLTVLGVSLLSACASAPPPAPPASAPAVPVAVNGRLTDEQAREVTLMAIGLVGTPYRYGGNTPEGGFDCSGLIAYVYRERAGVRAPRSVASLVDWGQAVPGEAVKTGDLAIFIQGGRASHAGIYVGEGRFVHAPSTGGVVRLDPLQSKYWSKLPVRFRRP
jgi:cell wall-associated NlpC family hydrolase